jgi:hypothetical protein
MSITHHRVAAPARRSAYRACLTILAVAAAGACARGQQTSDAPHVWIFKTPAFSLQPGIVVTNFVDAPGREHRRVPSSTPASPRRGEGRAYTHNLLPEATRVSSDVSRWVFLSGLSLKVTP